MGKRTKNFDCGECVNFDKGCKHNPDVQAWNQLDCAFAMRKDSLPLVKRTYDTANAHRKGADTRMAFFTGRASAKQGHGHK